MGGITTRTCRHFYVTSAITRFPATTIVATPTSRSRQNLKIYITLDQTFLAYYASISNQHLRQCGRHNCIDITLYKTLRRCIIVRDVMASKYHVKDVIALMHYIVQDVFT